MDGHAPVFAAEEGAGEGGIGVGIGEVEVVVACSGAVETADLAFDPDVVELGIGFELGADVSGRLRRPVVTGGVGLEPGASAAGLSQSIWLCWARRMLKPVGGRLGIGCQVWVG